MVTSGKAWREQNVVEVTLPSGFVARLRPVTTAHFVRRGKIPDFLLGAVVQEVEGKQDLVIQENAETAKQAITFQDEVCRMAFAYPYIVDNPSTDDEISIDDVPPEDVQFVYELVFEKPLSHLKSFRNGQGSEKAPVAPVDAATADAPPGE